MALSKLLGCINQLQSNNSAPHKRTLHISQNHRHEPRKRRESQSNKPQQLSEGPDEMGRRPLSTESIDRSHNEYPTQYKNHDYSGSSPVEKRSMYQPILDRDTVEDTPMVTLRTTDYTVATEEGHLRHLLPSYTKGCHETAGQDRPPDGRPLFPQIQPALPAL